MASVLIVEDDAVLAPIMRRHLEAAGFDVEHAGDGDRALRRIRFAQPDVVVLDLMIPGEVDGWRLIDELRGDGDMTPIIVVSARSSEYDRVHVIERGADDYLVKPASMKELVARVGAALRRSQLVPAKRTEETLEFPGLRLDGDRQRALLVAPDGTTADAELTVREFRLLWTLAATPGRVLGREELMPRLWGIPYRPRDRTIDVCVRKIREKVDERATHTYVQTHYGIGYRFEAEPHGDGHDGGA